MPMRATWWLMLVAAHAFAGENLVRNGGFEELAANGWPRYWSETSGWSVDGEAATGDHSLKVYTGIASAVVFQQIKLKAGHQYEVQVSVRTDDVVDSALRNGSASFYVEHRGPAGELLGALNPDGYASTLGWQILRVVTPPVPEGTAFTRVGIHLTNSYTNGSAWFDEVSVAKYEPPPLSSIMLYPNYRGLMGERTWEPTQIRVACELGRTNAPLSRLRVTADVRDSSGQILWTDGPTPPPSRSFETGFDLRWIIRGSYTMRLGLFYEDDEPLALQTFPFEVSHVADLFARPAFVRADNTLLVGGEPFFPLGLVDSFDPADASAFAKRLKLLSGSPFNTLANQELDLGTPFRIREIMTALNKRGVKTIFPLAAYDGVGGAQAAGILPRFKGTTPKARADDCIRRIRGAPGLIAWSIARHAAAQYEPLIAARYSRLLDTDENHPVLIVQDAATVADTRVYSKATDAFAIEMPASDVGAAGDSVTAAARSFSGYRPVWAVIDVYGNDEEAAPPPARRELRALSYMALVHGARGLIYDSLASIIADAVFDERWADLTSVAGELSSLARYLADGARQPPAGVVPAFLAVDSCSLTLGDKHLMIVINRQPRTVSAEIEITTPVDTVTVLFENRTLQRIGESIVDTLPPLDVNVYEY
ncbi:MAG: hypothetical protein HYX75_22645 [Acidobacteria bacterium]|nr:hypothetical protein [Acidobacteriota bacterium]